MDLEHTNKIPTADIEDARKSFRRLISGGSSLVIVVIGSSEISRRAVECADARAGVVVAGFDRKVVWVGNRTALSDEMKKLKPGSCDLSKEIWTGVVAFSLSPESTVMDIIRIDDDISFLRMEAAFLQAGSA